MPCESRIGHGGRTQATGTRILNRVGIMKTRAGLNDFLWLTDHQTLPRKHQLNQKRKVTLMRQDTLAALGQAIQQEPIARAPVSPG